MKSWLNICVIVTGLVVAGCGDDDDGPGPTADATVDAAARDAAMIDARIVDARVDSRVVDSGTINPPATDAGAGALQCGSMTCNNATQECCIIPNGGGTPSVSCINIGAACTGGGTARCDGTEDCPTNQVCCAEVQGASQSGAASCRGYGTGPNECSGELNLLAQSGQLIICNDPGMNSPDCPSDKRICQSCPFGGQTVRFCTAMVLNIAGIIQCTAN